MLIALHKNATTTPAKRAKIRKAAGSDYELMRLVNVCRDTIRKWRKRNTVQEELVIYLRMHLSLHLEDLLFAVKSYIEPEMSRSAMERLLRRRGPSTLPMPEKAISTIKPFKAYEQGSHIDVKHPPQPGTSSTL